MARVKAPRMKPRSGWAVLTSKGNIVDPMWKHLKDAQKDFDDLSKSRSGLRIARVRITEVKP